jgi:hypothetical protein
MRLTGVRIAHAIKPCPPRLELAWCRDPVRLSDWLDRVRHLVRWREPSENAGTIVAIVAALVVAAMAWKYGN